MGKPLYDDGTYRVTDAIVATPRRFYPLANTTASIRRDPLWLALGLTAFGAACLGVYGDLLRPLEDALIVGVCAVALVVGWAMTILRIDAVGHRRNIIIGRRKRIRSLYAAIRDARTADPAVTITTEA